MKPITTQLQNLFATRQFMWASLFQFSLVDGTTLYYCSGDANINYNSQTWSCGGTTGPYFDRKGSKAKAHWKIGTEVDTLQFDVIPGSSTIEGSPFLQAVHNGVFDGAELLMHRAYWPQQTWTSLITPTGVIANVFVGRVAEVDCSRTLAIFSVNSHLELLNQNMPRNLYQSGCLNTLYDSACTLNQASFAVSGTASSGSTASVINATLGQATGYFSLGKMKFTSGVNSGVWRGVKQYINGSPSTIALTAPFPQTPSTGDAFTIYAGCDKTMATCTNRFSNLANFRAAPFIPDTSTAV